MSRKKSHLSSLDQCSKKRYQQKIAEIDDTDPYEVPNNQWSTDFDDLPSISFLDIVSYLVLKTSAYSMEEFRAYKSLEAYNQFVCGWVRELKVKKLSEKKLTIVLGRVSIRSTSFVYLS